MVTRWELSVRLTAQSPTCVASGDSYQSLEYRHTDSGTVEILDVDRYIQESPHEPSQKRQVIRNQRTDLVDAVRRELENQTDRTDGALGSPGPAAFMNDGLNRPFVPGSTLKGLFRTILVYKLVKLLQDRNQINLEQIVQRDEDPRSIARRSIEEQYLGTMEEATDFGRCFQVSDSTRIDEKDLELNEIGVLNLTQSGTQTKHYSNFAEMLAPGGSVEFEVSVTDSEWRSEGDYEFPRTGQNLLKKPSGWIRWWKEFSEDWLQQEHEYYQILQENSEASGPDLDECLAFVEECLAFLKTHEQKKTALLPLGWSTSWRAKTIGLLLDDSQRHKLNENFDLDRGSRVELCPVHSVPLKGSESYCETCRETYEPWESTTPFPKTRKLVKQDGEYRFPPGVVRVDVLETRK